MASNIQYATTHRTSCMSQLITDLGTSAILEIYSGTPPANVAASLTGTTLLASLTCNASAFGTSSGGVLTISSITTQPSAAAGGTPSFFRLKTSGGTYIVQGTVGASGCDLNIPGGTITAGQAVSVSSWTITATGA